MIAAAEKSGALTLVMQRLSEFIFYQIEIRRKVIGALTYPAFMIVMAILVVFYLFVKIMPELSKSFTSLKVTLPWYTIMMNSISAWMQSWWIVCLVVVSGTIFGLFTWSKRKR
jgi:type II secretory pathway component PulF